MNPASMTQQGTISVSPSAFACDDGLPLTLTFRLASDPAPDDLLIFSVYNSAGVREDRWGSEGSSRFKDFTHVAIREADGSYTYSYDPQGFRPPCDTPAGRYEWRWTADATGMTIASGDFQLLPPTKAPSPS